MSIGASPPQLTDRNRKEFSMLKGSLAAIGLLVALALGACDDAGDGGMAPPQEPAPGAAPPATQ